jgi:pantothenate kinase type III
MRSGLFWGTIGAARELIARMSEGGGSQFRRSAAQSAAAAGGPTKSAPDPLPQVFLTGGAAASVAPLLAADAQYVPDLTLGGIALTAARMARP